MEWITLLKYSSISKMGALMTSSGCVTNFGWLKLSDSNPIRSGFTYKYNLTSLRLLENCATEFRGRIKSVLKSDVYVDDHSSFSEVWRMFYKAIMGKRKYVEQVCILRKALRNCCKMSWIGLVAVEFSAWSSLKSFWSSVFMLQMMKKWCL